MKLQLRDNTLLKIGCILAFLFTLQNFCYGGGTANISTSSSMIANTSVCQGSPAPTTTATFTNCGNGGGASTSTVTVSWYYNTTGATGTLTGATLLTSGVQTVTNTATVAFSITSANGPYNALMATGGNYYIFCTITSPSDFSCGIGSGATLYSGTSGTPGVRLITVSVPPTTSSNGGNQILAQCATSTTLTGNTPAVGTGTWTASPSAGVTFSPNANTPGATANGMTPGTSYTFTWTIASAGCPSSASSLTVTTSQGPGCWVYCNSTWSNQTDDWISNVTFNTIANASGSNAGGYGNYSGTCTSVMLGSIHQLCVTVTVNGGFTQHAFAYFDWNNDGDFSDAGESIDLGQVSGTGTLCANITIPAGATLGNTKMRIIEKYNVDPTSACESGSYGETEDYCVNIVPNSGTCTDGILNQDETGIDCGGASCLPCHCTNGIMDGDETAIDYGGSCGDCYNGIQDGSETGIDCGGPNCLPCSTNSTMTPSTLCCAATAQASVYPTNCDQVGTSAYNLNSPVVELISQSGACVPSPSPTGCGAVSTLGNWTHLSLEDGVNYLQMSWDQGAGDGINTGNSTVYSSLFQGTGCASLSYVSCKPILQFSSGSYLIYQATWSGLDPNQDVWIYTWNDNGKTYNLDFQFIGVNQQPTNTSCASSSAALGDACNLGAPGATFTTPGAGGYSCTGGSWGSNENTTFYSFTASATTGSLIIDGIICNDGSSGNAQFGVWTSCAAIGTYGANFLGCAVGTATISLSSLTPGQTYYIASDGYAGDNCKWGFSGTGIILPIELANFYGSHDGKNVNLFWSTSSESNNDYFTIQRTKDGKEFEDIGIIQGAGNSTSLLEYNFVDYSPYSGTSYYRIKQTDFDGKFDYTQLISVQSNNEDGILVKTINLMGQEVGKEYSGMVIDIYDNGKTVKRFKE